MIHVICEHVMLFITPLIYTYNNNIIHLWVCVCVRVYTHSTVILADGPLLERAHESSTRLKGLELWSLSGCDRPSTNH